MNKTLAHLGALAIVTALTQHQRGRVLRYRQYVELLNADLDPA